MTGRTQCIERAKRPVDEAGSPLEEGTVLYRGAFLRNQEAVSNRYSAEGDPPPYGHVLDPAPHEWRWSEGAGDGLSVNLEGCLPDPVCSVCLHPEPTKYECVVRFALPDLGDALHIELAARYVPIAADGDAVPPNVCHFEVLPTSQGLDDLREKLKAFGKMPARVKPGNTASVAHATSAANRIAAVFQVHRVDASRCLGEAPLPAA